MLRCILKGFILIIFIIFVTLMLINRSFLVINEKPKEADVIIVLSGDSGRLEKAAELYHARYANKVILSLATEKGTTPEEAIALGIPEQHLILEKEATSTYTNAVYTKEKMEENGFHSALVVSSDYHMRRAELVFDRVYNDSRIELVYVASFHNGYAKSFNEQNILIAREYIKLMGYWLGLYKFIDL